MQRIGSKLRAGRYHRLAEQSKNEGWDIVLDPIRNVRLLNRVEAQNRDNWGYDYMLQGLAKLGVKRQVNVCVGDTGALSKNVGLSGLNQELAYNHTNEEGLADQHDHFSMCAGIILGQVPGVKVGLLKHEVFPEDTFMGFGRKLLTSRGSGSYAWMAEFAYKLIDDKQSHPLLRDKPLVVNLSLGGGADHQPTKEAFEAMKAAGIFVICAAGNDGRSISFPGRLTSVLAAGAIDSREQRAGFSGRGPELDMTGPGVDVMTLGASRNEFVEGDGTSFGAPHVTAMVCAMLAAYPDIQTPDQLHDLVRSGTITKDLGGAGFDELYGWGVPLASTALDEAPDEPGDGPDEPGDDPDEPGDEPDNPGEPEEIFKERQHRFVVEKELTFIWHRVKSSGIAASFTAPIEFELDNEEHMELAGLLLESKNWQKGRIPACEIEALSERHGEEVAAEAQAFLQDYFGRVGFGMPTPMDVKFLLEVVAFFVRMKMRKDQPRLAEEIDWDEFTVWGHTDPQAPLHEAGVWDRELPGATMSTHGSPIPFTGFSALEEAAERLKKQLRGL